jgi:hypothetical protein
MTKAEEQKHTKRTDQSESLADLLRVAKPRLILRVTPDPYNELKYTVVPTVREAERETQEVIDEGYDPDHSPLGRPVYWRIVTRGGQKLYCSTFRTSHDQIIQAWGTPALPIAMVPERRWRRSKRSSRRMHTTAGMPYFAMGASA